MKANRHIGCVLAALSLVVLAGTASAQDYPSKPIRWIIPYNPGGGTDSSARILQIAIEQNKHRAIGDPDDFGWCVFKSSCPLARGSLREAKSSDEVIQRHRAGALGNDIAQDSERIAPVIRRLGEAHFGDFKPVQRDEAIGIIDTAMGGEPHDAEPLRLRAGELQADGRSRMERVTRPGFDLRQVQRDGVPIGGADAGPGSFLVNGRLGQRASCRQRQQGNAR